MVVTGVCSFYPQKRMTEKKRGRVFLKVIRTLVNAQTEDLESEPNSF